MEIISVNRLLGLSNLYYIDPKDQETNELRQVQSLMRRLNVVLRSSYKVSETDLGDRCGPLCVGHPEEV